MLVKDVTDIGHLIEACEEAYRNEEFRPLLINRVYELALDENAGFLESVLSFQRSNDEARRDLQWDFKHACIQAALRIVEESGK